MKKRVLSILLVAVMLMSMLPVQVLADTGSADGSDAVAPVVFTKTLEPASAMQPARIKLEAWTTGATSTSTAKIPTDIILVLDQSGSMDETIDGKTKLSIMKDAVEDFVAEVAAMNTENNDLYRVAIVGFASESGYSDNSEILTARKENTITSTVYNVMTGSLDTSKTYYIRDGQAYRAITYRTEGVRNPGWYTTGWQAQSVNISNTTVYDRVNEISTEYSYGVAFNDLEDTHYANALINCTDSTVGSSGELTNAIAELDGNGATRTDLGLEMAAKIFNAQADGTYTNRSKVVVLITDGVPTSWSDFDTVVANAAVQDAADMKDNGAHIFSMYLGTPSSDSVSFLQACSSNYPDATAYNSLGTQAATTYYSAHTNSEAVKAMFSGIVNSISANSMLNESSVVQDQLTEYFKLAADLSTTGTEQIEVYTVDKTATGWSETEVPFANAQVTIGGVDNKTVSVTGFHFANHCVTETAKDGKNDYGRKLVIYIPIVEDPSADTFGGWIPTNAGAAIYQDSKAVEADDPTITAETAHDDLTIRYDLHDTARAYHIDTEATYTVEYKAEVLNPILDEMVYKLPDGDRNQGVTMVYKLWDAGSIDKDGATANDHNDDVLLATLEVEPGKAVDVTNFNNWQIPEGAPTAGTITVDNALHFGEKIYVLTCTLTSTNPVEDEREVKTVYGLLDIAVTNEDKTHIVYGDMDDGGVLTVVVKDGMTELSGTLFNNTYTEAVVEGGSSDKMTFTPKEGYEIERITKRMLHEHASEKVTVVVYDIDDESTHSNVTFDQETGAYTFQATNVQGGVEIIVETRLKEFTLTTSDDAGSEIIDSTTYTYDAVNKLNVPFRAIDGYQLNTLTVNETVYSLSDATARETLRAEYAAEFTLEKDAAGNDVVVAGHVNVSRTQDNAVHVTSLARSYKVTLKYFVKNADGTYTEMNDQEEKREGVSYGTKISTNDFPAKWPRDVKEIGGYNYTLSDWYLNYVDHPTGADEFYGVVNLGAATMPAYDLTLYAVWTKNPNVSVATVTVEKQVDNEYTADSKFEFIALFHEQKVGSVEITIPANTKATKDEPASKTQNMEIILTDKQATSFKNGNGVIYLYEIPANDNIWIYDNTRYELRWETDKAVLYNESGTAVEKAAFHNERIAPALEVKKTVQIRGEETVATGKAAVGDVLHYTITVENTGNTDLTNVKIQDTMDGATGTITVDAEKNPGVTYQNGIFQIASLPVPEEGQKSIVTIQYTYTVQAEDAGKTIENVAEVVSNHPDEPEDDNSTETEVEKKSVTISKTVDKTTAKVGEKLTYTITVANTGNVGLSDVKIQDAMEGASQSIDFTNTENVTYDNGEFLVKSLPAAQDGSTAHIVTITYTYTVDDADRGNTITNAVKVEDEIKDPEDDPEDDETTVTVPGVEITKTVSPQGTAKVGDTLTYTIDVYNEGTKALENVRIKDTMTNASGSISFTDTDNVSYANGEFTVKSLPIQTAGSTAPAVVITYTYVVQHADAGKTIGNTAVVQDDLDDPEDDDTTETEIDEIAAPDVDITKFVSPEGTAKIGDTLTYTITVVNTGNVDLSNLRIEDHMTNASGSIHFVKTTNVGYDGSAFVIGTLAKGGTETITYTYVVQAKDAGKTLKNVAVAKINDNDTDPKDDTETEVPAIDISKSVKPTTAKVGDELIYELVVKNIGEVDVDKVEVQDTFSSKSGGKIAYTDAEGDNVAYDAATGMFTVTELKAGETATIQYTYKVALEDVGQPITNSVVQKSDISDPGDKNDDETEVEVEVDEGLIVEKKAYAVNGKQTSNFNVKTGDVVTWTITVTNTGNVKLENVTVSDELTVGTQKTALKVYDSMDEDANEVGEFNLAVSEKKVFYVSYTVQTEDVGKTLINHVAVKADDGDEDPTNDPTDDDTDEEFDVEKPVTPSKPSAGHKPALNKKDHVAYVIGYEDETVRPQNNITRAEVATIFFRLLTDESRAYYWSQTNDFSDVSDDDWFNNAVSTMANAGILTGYPDGSFRPNNPITRAEFAAIAARFSDVEYDGDARFSDVPKSHWAFDEVALAKYLGWITGYPDNTFRPDQNITRAEAMTLINRVLERAVEEEHMLPDMVKWVDNKPSDWFYEAVQEATNSHVYTRLDKKVPNQSFCYEDWIEILLPPDWAALEKSWSEANDQ